MHISRDHLATFEEQPQMGWLRRVALTAAIAVATAAVLLMVGRRVQGSDSDFTRAGQTFAERPAAEADIVVGH